MQLLINTLLLAVLLPAPARSSEPTCRAQLKGTLLTTEISFQGGFALQAPWKVVQTRRDHNQGPLAVDLVLDRIEETDDLTGQRKSTKLATLVHVTVEGATEADVVYQAAQTWCNTVIKVRGEQAAAAAPALLRPGHIT